MNKTIRIVLYVLSTLTVIGVIAALIFSGGNTPAGQTAVSPESGQTQERNKTEEAGKIEENGKTQKNPEKEPGSGDAESAAGENRNPREPQKETGQTGSAETEQGEKEPSGSTTVLFTGDVLFANAFKAGYDAKGISGVVSEELLSELKSADILMVNNEFPFSERGTPAADKQFTFRCEPSYVKGLTDMGVDLVSLANNHTLDYGKEALSDTFAALDQAGILYGGAGDSVERAEQLQIIEKNGRTFGFLAVSRVIPEAGWKAENSLPGLFSCYDETRLIELVKEGKEQCDFLAVYPHWGVEYQAYPQEYQRTIAEKCVEAGADVIVGSHTHCLQGIEYIDGKPVFYSLGNFIFGQNIDRSAAVEVTMEEDGTVSYRLIPVSASGGITAIRREKAGKEILKYMESISDSVKVDENGFVTEM